MFHFTDEPNDRYDFLGLSGYQFVNPGISKAFTLNISDKH